MLVNSFLAMMPSPPDEVSSAKICFSGMPAAAVTTCVSAVVDTPWILPAFSALRLSDFDSTDWISTSAPWALKKPLSCAM